jgi:casein kinase 1
LLTKTETLKISGIPKLYDLVKNEKGKFLVLEVLGPDLETLFQKCGRKFSLSTTTLIALRMLELLE